MKKKRHVTKKPSKLPPTHIYKRKHCAPAKRFRLKQAYKIQVSRSHLKQTIHKITTETSKEVEHELVTDYGEKAAEVVLKECNMPSFDLLASFSHLNVFPSSLLTLLLQIRKSLLKHDWYFSCHLLRMLINANQVNKRLQMYIVRVVLMIILNQPEGHDRFEEFLTLSLGINEENFDDYIKTIFVLPERMKLGVLLEASRSKKQSSKNSKTSPSDEGNDADVVNLST